MLSHLITANMIIGGLSDSVYQEDEVAVDQRARLYVFSDGVYEVDRPDVTMWSLEKLRGYLLQHALEKAENIDAHYRIMQGYHSQDILGDDYSMMSILFT